MTNLTKPVIWLLVLAMLIAMFPAVPAAAMDTDGYATMVYVNTSKSNSHINTMSVSAGGETYSDLQAAYDAVADGGTIVLESDIQLTQTTFFIQSKTVSLTANQAIRITPDNSDRWGTSNSDASTGKFIQLLYVSSGTVNIGSNITLDAKGKCRVITMESGTATLNLYGCAIQNGHTTASTGGAGIIVNSGNTVTADGGTRLLKNVAEGASSTPGGAIHINIGEGALVNLRDVTFEDNSANSGGAIYNYLGTVTCTSDTKFIGNSANQRGGAIHNHGDMVLSGTTIAGHNSGQFGGAIYVSASTGVGGATGRLVLNDVTITDNYAGSNGGGIYVANAAELYISGTTTVSGNTNSECEDNAYIATTNAKVYTHGKLGEDVYIGISTSNPAKEKVVVRSLMSAATISGVTLPAYTMSAGDTEKYVYDSEVWLIRPSSAANESLWLTYNLEAVPGDGLNHVVFDFNLPGATPVIYSGVQAGSAVPVPIQGDSAIGTQPVKFLGWFDAPVGGNKVLGASVTAQSGLKVFYAQWEIINTTPPAPLPEGSLFPVFFDQNHNGGGLTSLVVGSFKFTVYKSSGSISDGDGTITYTPEDYTITLPFAFPGDPARTGYTFAGWGVTSNALSGVGSGYYPTETVTLYAIWRAKTYSITWDANGGFGGGVTTQNHDDKLILPAAPPTRPGYAFTGWYADRYGGTPVSADTVVTGAATYYAGWTPAEYSITWDTNYTGGSVAVTQQKQDEALVVQPNPVRNGYSFAGWWTQPGGQGTNAQSYGLVRGHQIFYAYWVTDTMSYTVTLDWDDFGNNDAVRPETVTVALLRNGLSTGLTYTFSAAAHSGDVWNYTFSNLPVADVVSNPYVYSVAVVSSIPDDYTYASDFSSSAYAGYIRLTHTRITRDVPVYVVWDDDSDRDGYRPTTVDVQLCANGTPIADAEARIALPGTGNTWTHTFPNCQKYYNQGVEIVYSVVVSASISGELAKYGVNYSALTGLTATLTHAVESVSKTVMVEWQDNGDQDGNRPASMTVQLYADNQPVAGKFITLSAANGWNCTWAGLPKLRDGGTPIVYSAYVSSTLVDYTAATTEMTVEMTYTPSQTSISAFVSWTDENDADGLRPDFVIAELIADCEPTGDTQQLSAVNSWRAVWTGYPIYHEGSRIEYTFRVKVPSGYNAEYMGIYDTSGLSAVLRHVRIREDFTATIVWNDGGNLSGARMALVRVMLYADGSPIDGTVVSVTEATGWQHTYTGYPVYRDNGTAIKYSIGLDSSIGHYAASFDGMTLTLSLTPETVDVPLNILWDDANNAAGLRPAYVAVTLSINGIPSSFTAAATAQSDWSVLFEGFAKYKEGSVGERVLYEAKVTVPPGYTVFYIGQTAVLTAQAATADFYATVTWQDNDNQYGHRPAKATLTLYADYGEGATPTGMTRTVSAADDWGCAFEGLPTTVSGKRIVYLVAISGNIGNYTPTYDGMDVYMRHNSLGSGGTGGDGYTTDYTARLVWADNYNANFSRPFAVTVNLFSNGAVVRTAVLTEDNLTGAYTWAHLWAGLPTYSSGSKITYTIGLGTVSNGYTASVQGESIVLTNVRDIAVTVAWQDNSNQSGKRPAALPLSLLADGESNGQTFSQSGAGNTWVYTFKDQPVWSPTNGSKELIYTWAVPGSEASTLTANAYTIDYHEYAVNTVTIWREVDIDDYTAEVIWDDDTDRDGLRPASVTATLYANGAPTGKSVTITGDADAARWAGTFAALPVYSQGHRIIYTITINALAGYATAASATTPQITLRHVPARVDVPAAITWDDSSSDGGLDRFSITVELTIDEKPTGETAVLSAGNGWRHTWPGRFAYHDHGTAYRYSYILRTDLRGDYEAVTDDDGNTVVKRVRFSISGTVEDTVGHAVPGAAVTLYNSAHAAIAQTTTDNTGAWQFTGVAKGTYTVRAAHISTASLTGTESVIVAAANVRDVVIALDGNTGGDGDKYTYTVTGLVRDSNGTAAAGAQVRLWSADNRLLGTVTADIAGRYQFTGIGNGACQISVVYRRDGYSYTALGAVTVHNANIQAPTITVNVPPIVVAPEPCVVSGKTVDETGKPLPGVAVILTGDGGGEYIAVTGSDGTFRLNGVPDGGYTVEYYYHGTLAKTERITISSQLFYVLNTATINTATVTQLGKLEGVVKDKSGKPVSGAEVFVYDKDGRLVGYLVTGADGKYSFTLPIGKYNVVISYPFTHEENHGLPVNDDTAENGTGIPNVDVTADSYTISGYVLDEDGNPIEGAHVYLYRQDGESARQLVGQITSDQEGYYEFKNLPAGNYIVKVVPRYGVEENFDVIAKPNSPNDGEDGGPSVTTDSYTVSGTVLDDDGDPVRGATVILTDLDGNIVGKQVTGEDGKYEFSGLDEGAYILIISYPDKEDMGGGEVDVPGGGNPGGGNPGGGGSPGGGSGGSGGTGGSGGSGSGGGGSSALLHKPYVYGYVDGTFRPLNPITRSEASAILSRVSAGFEPQRTYAVSFPDVPQGAWYERNLGYCVRAGIFTGFPDGTFGPEAPITRAEFAAIVARLLGLDSIGTSKFEDVTGTWAEGYIAQLTERGIITGFPDGTFKPAAEISRAEAVTILNRALNRNPIPASLDKLTEGGVPFSDVDRYYWAYYQVLEAAVEHEHW